MSHERWIDEAALYATGALDGEDRRAFESHLSAGSGCVECRAEIMRAHSDLAALSSSFAATPSPAAKAALMRRIDMPAWRRNTRFALPVLVPVLVLAWVLWGALRPAPVSAPPTLAQSDATHAMLSEGESRYAELKSHNNSAGEGQLFWNKQRCGGCFLFKNLPNLPKNKIFQLWAIEGSAAPVSLGVFVADGDGSAHIDVEELKTKRGFDHFAISIEANGGAKAPALPILSGRLL